MKQAFDVERESQLLSTLSKRAWEVTLAEIEKFAKEERLTLVQKESLIKRNLAALRYADLQEDNEYNRRSTDELAKRKIERNNIVMGRMNQVFQECYDDVKEFESKLEQRLNAIARGMDQGKNNTKARR